jgi:hypothetical protein
VPLTKDWIEVDWLTFEDDMRVAPKGAMRICVYYTSN